MSELRDELIEYYELSHLIDSPEELKELMKITNQITYHRDYRDFLERSISHRGITANDIRLLDMQYARLDKLHRQLLTEIERLQGIEK